MSLLFTSHVPSQTLAKAWPSLSHEENRSLMDQLEGIMTRIRQINRHDRPLGLLNRQGVVDARGWSYEFRSKDIIQTLAEFEKLFS